jgi:Family of unknown function (DUF5706)
VEDETVVARTAQRLLDDARAELARADEKASSVLGTVSTLGAVVAVVPSGLQPDRKIAGWWWVCGLSICGLATVMLMLAALPRLTTGSRRHVLAHFGDVSRVRHECDLGYLIGQLATRPGDAILSELKIISKIVVTKYRFTQLGIMLSIAGGVFLILGTL